MSSNFSKMDSSDWQTGGSVGGSVLSIDASRSILNPKALLALKVAFAQRCKWAPLMQKIPAPTVPVVETQRHGVKRGRNAVEGMECRQNQPEIKSDDIKATKTAKIKTESINNEFMLFDLGLPELPRSDEFDQDFDPFGNSYTQQNISMLGSESFDVQQAALDIANRLVEWRETFEIEK